MHLSKPVEQYSASDMALVVRDLISEAAWGLAEHAASKEAARALLDDTSKNTPAVAHSSFTCKMQHQPLHQRDILQRLEVNAASRMLTKQAEADAIGSSASTEVMPGGSAG